MKTLNIDIMIGGRFYKTLKYEYSPIMPLDVDDVEEFVFGSVPNLVGKTDWSAILCGVYVQYADGKRELTLKY